MPVLEKTIEERIVELAESLEFIVEKVQFAANGYPDRVFIYKGITLWMELKRKPKKPERLQVYRMEDINDHGGIACWTDNVLDARYAFQQVMAAASLSADHTFDHVISTCRRSILGSWTGEDLNLSDSIQSLKVQRVGEQDAGDRPAEGDLRNVASRGQEVVELPRAVRRHPPR